MGVYTDDFNRADAGTLGANWNDPGANYEILSADCNPAGAGFANCWWDANVVGDDQYSQVRHENATDYMGVTVRNVDSANYYIYFSHGELREVVAGSDTTIATWGAIGNGDTGKLSMSGTTLEGFVNTVSQGTVTSSAHASGQPGIGSFDTGALMDDWEGGDLGGGDTFGWFPIVISQRAKGSMVPSGVIR